MSPVRGSLRRRLLGILSTGVVAAALVGGGAPVRAGIEPDPEAVLSHFLCYRGTFAPFTPEPVKLGDLVGDTVATVKAPKLFCNPAKKTRGDIVTPIVDRDQHLKAYAIVPDPLLTEEQPAVVANQFVVKQDLTIRSSATRLLVPTRKAPHDFPEGLDHFTCRTVTEGAAIDKRVRLKDQFGSYRTTVGRPRLHCLPVTKSHDDIVTDIQHQDAHLVCYSIAPRKLDPPIAVRTANQFERARVKAEVAVMLCVPSTTEV